MSVSRQVRRQMERQAARAPASRGPGRSGTVGRHPEIRADTPGKGKFDQNCNRTDCQAPIAGENWFNTSTRAYYCTICAILLNRESRRFDGIDICMHVKTEDDRPPYPYEATVRFREERKARHARMVQATEPASRGTP